MHHYNTEHDHETLAAPIQTCRAVESSKPAQARGMTSMMHDNWIRLTFGDRG